MTMWETFLHGAARRLALFSALLIAVRCQSLDSVHNGCNETILSGEGIIASPTFPSAYEPGSDCEWRISVEQDRTVLLTFRYFDLESSANCAYDRVQVYNGHTRRHPRLGRFCGAFRPSDVIATSNRMLVTFTTDDSNHNTGFMAMFFSLPAREAGANSCGGIMTSPSGKFSSVNFPKSNYPNSLTCVWHVRASAGHVISLRFPKFTLEISENCRYDAVTVFGGSTEADTSKLIGTYCKTSEIPDEIVWEKNEMFVSFRADSSGNDVGFLAEYITRPRARSTTVVRPDLTVSETRHESTTAATSVTSLPPDTTLSTSSDGDCSCFDAPVNQSPCQVDYAFYGKVTTATSRGGRVRQLRVVVGSMLKPNVALAARKRSKLTITIQCARCYPTFARRGRFVFLGSAGNVRDALTLADPDRAIRFDKAAFKAMKKQIKRCRRQRSAARRVTSSARRHQRRKRRFRGGA